MTVNKILPTLASHYNNIADMSEKQQNDGISAGKVKARRIPADVDLTDLVYLEYRDIKRIAAELSKPADYVARVKRGETYNVVVLAALLKKARENKKALEEPTT